MSEMIKFVNEYSINNYGNDYNMCVDLTYKYPIKNESKCRTFISRLKSYLNKNSVFIDGIFVNEYDSNFSGLHNHLLLYSDSDFSTSKGLIFNYWKNIGLSNINQYDRNGNYGNYIVKHLNKTENNNWDFIMNL